MKIGTAILFGLVLVFFAAFLVSANAQASAENHQLWESLSMVEAENLALKAQVQELTALLKAKQASLNKMQAQNENLIAHTETLTIERDQALAQAVQTQQALEQHRMICTQTNPFADSIFALTGRTDINFLEYNAMIPILLTVALELTGASGGGWYWWHLTHHPPQLLSISSPPSTKFGSG